MGASWILDNSSILLQRPNLGQWASSSFRLNLTGSPRICQFFLSMNVRIDGYAIVTLNPRMESVLRDGPGEMKQVEEEWRWYGMMGNLNMNVKVLDYRAFISRAQQRNRAFFNALRLMK